MVIIDADFLLDAFQSAPRSEDRGDWVSISSPTTSSQFQSAPRSEDRGDRCGIRFEHAEALFQSAPRSEDRGDARAGAADK